MIQLDALARLARRRGLTTLLLRDPANLAWLLGCRVHVPQTLDAACFDVVVDGLDGAEPTITVISNSIEAPRLAEDELPAGMVDDHRVVPWWGDRTSCFPPAYGAAGRAVGADRPWADAVLVAADLAVARCVLSDRQAVQLRQVCADAAAATGRVAVRLRPGLTEYEVAGRLAAELLGNELDPVVLMVAADSRDRRHRHPLPTGRAGSQSFLLVCCARRHGLVASVTRAVCFRGSGLDESERADRHRAVLGVEQVFLDHTRPGATLGEVVAAGTDSYASHGFDPQEWTRHHQGGLTGWVPREFPASRDSDAVLAEQMVVAWNPSGDGCKVEDTALVTAAGPELLVHDPDWPTLEVGGRFRPDLLWL